MGKNFVFDNRMVEKVGEQIIAKCHQCGAPCDTQKNCRYFWARSFYDT